MMRTTKPAAAALALVFTLASAGPALADTAGPESRIVAGEPSARALPGAKALPEGVAGRYASWEASRDLGRLIAPLPRDSGFGRRIVYAVSAQRVWLVESDETVVDTYLVSGRAGTPRPGTYRVFSKSPKAWSKTPGVSMRYMVRFTVASSGLAIGFHDIPRSASGRLIQEYQDLGTPQSAGCVRQPEDKAAFLYEWAPVGTTVVVLR